jgi:folate-binding Fe-S cluster repair protein YgfZ
MPAPGTAIMQGDSEAGELLSGRDGRAMALLRLDAVERAAEGATLTAGEARITPERPAWMKP